MPENRRKEGCIKRTRAESERKVIKNITGTQRRDVFRVFHENKKILNWAFQGNETTFYIEIKRGVGRVKLNRQYFRHSPNDSIKFPYGHDTGLIT